MKEQISEWGREQDEHTPSNALMGVGEMAMWNALHPAVDGRLPCEEWGALHQAQHIASRGQKEVWLRAVAGCSRYTTVYAARQGSYQEFRSPHTDAQKLAVLQCPCGMGVQDSMHVLLCEHRALLALKKNKCSRPQRNVCNTCPRGGATSATKRTTTRLRDVRNSPDVNTCHVQRCGAEGTQTDGWQRLTHRS